MSINPDIIGYSAAFLTTVSFLPQVIKIIRTKDTKSLSLGMYLLLTAGIVLWITYGILRNDYVLIIANVFTILLTLIVLIYKIAGIIQKQEA